MPVRIDTGTGGCSSAWKLDSSRQGGFQGALTVTDTATSATTPWKIAFTLPAGTNTSNGWNGTFTQSGTTVTVTAPPHSPSLNAGAAVSPGFTATGTLNQAARTT